MGQIEKMGERYDFWVGVDGDGVTFVAFDEFCNKGSRMCKVD